MDPKRYRLTADQIESIALGRGSCIASDRITVDGEPVRFLYREQPDHETDSGWRFLAGDESQEYIDEPENLGIHDVNTIVNYDRDVLDLLDEGAPAQFERSDRGQPWRRVA